MTALALGAALALAACPGPEEAADPASPEAGPSPVASPVAPPPATEAIDGKGDIACNLLVPEDFERVVGERPDEGFAAAPMTCAWPGIPLSVTLAALPAADPEGCAMARPEGAPSVEGLGVEAWWEFVEAETGVGNVVACPPGHHLTLMVGGTAGEAELRATAEELAARALERL